MLSKTLGVSRISRKRRSDDWRSYVSMEIIVETDRQQKDAQSRNPRLHEEVGVSGEGGPGGALGSHGEAPH